MFKNYFTIAFRNLLRHKQLTIINLTGLIIGITAFFLVILYVNYEFNYDNYHKDINLIYRLETNFSDTLKYATSPFPLHKEISKVQGIETATHLTHVYNVMYLKTSDDRKYTVGGGVFGDGDFFKIFNIPFIEGSIDTSLSKPNTMVITRSFADKYFANQNPVGQEVRIDNQFWCRITGIVADVPSNSHFTFNFFVSYSTTSDIFDSTIINNWNNNLIFNYIKIRNDADKKQVENQINDIIHSHGVDKNIRYDLNPVRGIHLRHDLKHDIKHSLKATELFLYISITLSILIIACFNYMNLSTAYSTSRATEVGIRKVVGASRLQLILQFVGEAVILSVLSLFISIFITELIIPHLNSMLKVEIVLLSYYNIPIFIFMFLVALLTGIFSGLYPAFMLSRFQPVTVFKGITRIGVLSNVVRKILVVMQFIISTVLVIVTIFIFRQLIFIGTSQLGFSIDNLVTVNFLNREARTVSYFDDFIDELVLNDEVENANYAIHTLGKKMITKFGVLKEDGTSKMIEGLSLPSSKNTIETFKINILKGEENYNNIMSKYPDKTVCLLNETAVKELGGEVKIGDYIKFDIGYEIPMVAITSDFHYSSFRDKISPVVTIIMRSDTLNIVSPEFAIRLKNIDEASQNAALKVFEKYFPNNAFEIRKMTDRIKLMYLKDSIVARLLFFYTALALMIASIGLVGLISFLSRKRQKEIGIRKVNGALTFNIIYELSKEFFVLIGLSQIIAIPVAYLIVKKWLSNFQYHVDISISLFIGASIFVFVISFLTLIIQSYKAATINPMEALKYE